MFRLTKLISFHAEASFTHRAALASVLEDAVRSNENVLRARLEPTGAGAVNGGDLIWHVQFADESKYLACVRDSAWRDVTTAFEGLTVSHVDSVTYLTGTLGIREQQIINGIHRILLLAIRPGIAAKKVAQFEAEMLEMARYVPAIRNWGLSNVIEGTGTRRWTHVWEQEFQDTAGLFGPYMMHPFHFAFIDRWFDTQSHDWIVDPTLCSTLCPFTQSMLAPELESSCRS